MYSCIAIHSNLSTTGGGGGLQIIDILHLYLCSLIALTIIALVLNIIAILNNRKLSINSQLIILYYSTQELILISLIILFFTQLQFRSLM